MPLHKNVRIHDEEFHNQIKNVLRLAEGNTIIVADGITHEAEATITGFDKDTVELTLGEIVKNEAEPTRRVVLYLSMLKNSNFELAIQKAVECGVGDIVPIVSDRTVKLRLNSVRMNRIIREAAEQCGRGAVPKLHESRELPDAISHAANNDLNLILHPKGTTIPALASHLQSAYSIGVFVGPEGGWSDDEREIFEHRSTGDTRFFVASLGIQVLRAETAAIIGTYIAAHAADAVTPATA